MAFLPRASSLGNVPAQFTGEKNWQCRCMQPSPSDHPETVSWWIFFLDFHRQRQRPAGHMTVSLSSSTTGEGFSSSQGRVCAECSSAGMWSSCPDDGIEFSDTEPFFTYPGRFLCPFTGAGPSLVVRWRPSGPLAVTLVTLVCDTIGP